MKYFLQEPAVSEAQEKSSGLFDISTAVYKQTLFILLALLGGLVVLSCIWDVRRRKKLKRLVLTDSKYINLITKSIQKIVQKNLYISSKYTPEID